MNCHACQRPSSTEGSMLVQLRGGIVRICAACAGLPFAMVWRMIRREAT